MPKYSLKYQNWTIIFGIQLMRRRVLPVKKIANGLKRKHAQGIRVKLLKKYYFTLYLIETPKPKEPCARYIQYMGVYTLD